MTLNRHQGLIEMSDQQCVKTPYQIVNEIQIFSELDLKTVDNPTKRYKLAPNKDEFSLE